MGPEGFTAHDARCIMTWRMLAYNMWIIAQACTVTLLLAGFVCAGWEVYNRAYMRLVKYYSQKAGTRND